MYNRYTEYIYNIYTSKKKKEVQQIYFSSWMEDTLVVCDYMPSDGLCTYTAYDTALNPSFGFHTSLVLHYYSKAILLYHSFKNSLLNRLYYVYLTITLLFTYK